jgi:hypothetical protein
MPFLNAEERKLTKAVLSDILNDADLNDQLSKLKVLLKGTLSDSRDAILRQYVRILQDIVTERKNFKPPHADARTPDLQTLKRNLV